MVLNGPNLQRLGTREPDVYGVVSLPEVAEALTAAAPEGVEIDVLQTDDEAALIGWLHVAAETRSPVILNPAAFAHYSYALHDAVRIVTTSGVPVVEVHITNPAAGEEFRRESVVSPAATGVIAGFGADGYLMALDWLVRRWIGNQPPAAG